MIAPQHWEEDRPQTWEEWSRPYGLVCMDCDVKLMSFEMTSRRLTEESMTEIAFSEEDVIPILEIICTNCFNRGCDISDEK